MTSARNFSEWLKPATQVIGCEQRSIPYGPRAASIQNSTRQEVQKWPVNSC
jgi:hypothetical protein